MTINRKSILTLFGAGLMTALAAAPAEAITNSSFESKLPGTWETVGSVNRLGKFRTLNPTDGSRHSLLVTNRVSNARRQQRRFRAAEVAQLETFVGLDLDAMVGDTVFDGSAISQTFTLAEKSDVKFDWSFGHSFGDEGDIKSQSLAPNDVAFLIVNGVYTQLAQLDSVAFNNLGRPGPGRPGFWQHTDYASYMISGLDVGVHTILLGVANVRTDFGRSNLLLDNFMVSASVDQEPDTDPIPEPVSAGLTMLGFGALAYAARRRR